MPNKPLAHRMVALIAAEYLAELMPIEYFLGSTIEQVIAAQATLIYQDVNDRDYYGAALTTATETLIAINTHQPLRQRYQSVAHELWSLWYGQMDARLLTTNFDHAKAACQVAAMTMMPAELMISTWLSFTAETTVLARVMQLADLAMVPYAAVVTRLFSLEIQVPPALSALTHDDWLVLRQELGVAPSPLDQIRLLSQFEALKTVVTRQVKHQQLTIARGATVLTPVEPVAAAELWSRQRQLIEMEMANDGLD